jgi:hypothetical protein
MIRVYKECFDTPTKPSIKSIAESSMRIDRGLFVVGGREPEWSTVSNPRPVILFIGNDDVFTANLGVELGQ